MDLEKKMVPSEASYYVCVTHDLLMQLDSLLEQLSKQGNSNNPEDYIMMEKKINRIIHERLPKLLQQLWQEICLGVTASLKAHTSNTSQNEMIWTEIGEQCSQLSIFRSNYRFIMAALSGKAMSHKSGTIVEIRSMARLLQLREYALASDEGQQWKQWMRDFVMELYQTVLNSIQNGNVGIDEVQRKITVCKETIRGSSSQQQQQPSPPQQIQQNHRLISSNINLEAEVESYSDEEICKEHLKFLRAACIGLADDLINFLKPHILTSQSSPSLEEQKCNDVKSTLSDSEKKTTNEERTTTEGKITTVAELSVVVKDSDLTFGADRWVFFRTRPNDTPPLTLDEVAQQVRGFYAVYNAEKSNMAIALADGYGEDYTDLFDSLEYRYCFPTPTMEITTTTVNTATTTTTTTGITGITTSTIETATEEMPMFVPSEKQLLSDGEVHKEAENGAEVSNKTGEEGGGCSVM
ncbi:hypothetical protein LSM04_005185 [Trypanosoma melophagium]|uniref:uncharacterized protein n=1 Tax=Trypanosoma melophagium TaxID=715481 RepID=UPI00351A8ED9|nr:hypothetical protein LSM04_005185 [Trypanosoma melophagium]